MLEKNYAKEVIWTSKILNDIGLSKVLSKEYAII